MNSLKRGEGVPLLNFVGDPGVPILNFEGGPGIPLLNFELGVPGLESQSLMVLGPGVLVPLLHHVEIWYVFWLKQPKIWFKKMSYLYKRKMCTAVKHGVSLTKHYPKNLRGATSECWEWPWIYHGDKNWQTNNSIDITNSFVKVVYRRMNLSGHCIQHPEEIASKLGLWQPAVRRKSVGRQCRECRIHC